MNDTPLAPPAALVEITQRALAVGFDASCDPGVGALLRILAASTPTGRVLELGTGCGASTAWLLDGLVPAASLVTVESDASLSHIARTVLGDDPRITFRIGDGSDVLRSLADQRFDLVFADTWPGKYHDLDLALALLAPGAVYVVDDMLPQPNWPAGHGDAVTSLLAELDARPDLVTTRLAWASGVVLAARR